MNRRSDDPAQWCWVLPEGKPVRLDEWELVSGLSRGEVSPDALVWRTGWADWIPARSVAELRTALPPGAARPSVAPKLSPGRTEPPEVPKKASALGGRAFPPKRPPLVKAGGPPPPPVNISEVPHARPPISTLVDRQEAAATGTLRPPGAVPPPPRSMPSRPRSGEHRLELRPVSVEATPIPDGLDTDPAKPIPEDQRTGAPARKQSEPEAAQVEAPSPSPPSLGAPALPDTNQHLEPPARPGEKGPAEVSFFGVRMPRPILFVLVGLGLSTLSLGVLAAALLLRDSPPPEQTPSPSELSEGAEVPQAARLESPASSPCRISRVPQRLAPAIVLNVPPYLAELRSEPQVAVGVAASETTARGYLVDPLTLTSRSVFERRAPNKVLGVSPITVGEQLSFEVDREGDSLRYARTLNVRPRTSIGLSDEGLSWKANGAPAKLVWPSAKDLPITEPRVTSIAGIGHAVTFRRGGQEGAILLGWLKPDGTALTALEPIDPGARYVGTPMVAAHKGAILVVFSVRNDPSEAWSVRIAPAEHGRIPKAALHFTIPEGGLGVGAIAPTATGLDDGGFLLQWTEGSAGQHQVRAQTLDRELQPVGEPLRISPRELNSGQGALVSVGKQALSLFVVWSAEKAELWGAALQCP